MRRYVIERELPEVEKLSTEQLNGVREISNGALRETGPRVLWVESFVTPNRIYCHYMADNEESVREHARLAGLPCTKVSEVHFVVDPLLASRQSV
jgi:hypothetical protein